MRGLEPGSIIWALPGNEAVPFTVAAELASGHEGTVYEMVEAPGGKPLVVKIVAPSHRRDVEQIVTALMSVNSEAWFDTELRAPRLSLPVAPAHLARPHHGTRSAADGYFMLNLMRGATAPTSRVFEVSHRQRLKALGWRTLVSAAISLSETIDRLHDHGLFVGDLALENSFIDTETGAVTLIDVDSFSAPAPGGGRFAARHFRPENSPPEVLRDVSLVGKRSYEADRFALAVAIARLLFEGYHPFGGTPLYSEAAEENEQDEALNIRYGVNWISHPNELVTRQHQMPVTIIPEGLRELFWQAFATGHSDPASRPSAAMWAAGLRDVHGGLAQCEANRRHAFSAHQDTCPWCRWAEQFGRDPYPANEYWERIRFAEPVAPTQVEAPGPTATRKKTRLEQWQEFAASHDVGDLVYGRVTMLLSHGSAFEVSDGVEGLVEVSEMSTSGVDPPNRIVAVGDELWVKVIEIDVERRHLGLSARQAVGGVLASEYQEQFGERAFDADGNYVGSGDLDPHTIAAWAQFYRLPKLSGDTGGTQRGASAEGPRTKVDTSRPYGLREELPNRVKGCSHPAVEILNECLREYGISRTRVVERRMALAAVLDRLDGRLDRLTDRRLPLSELGAWVTAIEAIEPVKPKLKQLVVTSLRSTGLELVGEELTSLNNVQVSENRRTSGCSPEVHALFDDLAREWNVATNRTMIQRSMTEELASWLCGAPHLVPDEGLRLSEIGAWIASASSPGMDERLGVVLSASLSGSGIHVVEGRLVVGS